MEPSEEACSSMLSETISFRSEDIKTLKDFFMIAWMEIYCDTEKFYFFRQLEACRLLAFLHQALHVNLFLKVSRINHRNNPFAYATVSDMAETMHQQVFSPHTRALRQA